MNRRRLSYIAVILVPLLAVAALGWRIASRHATPATPRGVYTAPPAGPAVHAAVPAARYAGVYEPGTPGSWAPVAGFSAATGVRPGIVLYYSSWWKPFPTRFAEQAHAHGAVPFAQMIPYGKGVSMHRLVAGQYDGYLRTFAEQIRRYGHPVIIGFAPEPNGPWYSWGWHQLPPSVWVKAWRHVVNVFRAQGAQNVTWLWTVNRDSRRTGPIADWWPGPGYVTWVGIDGYFFQRAATFRNIFGPALAAVRKVTTKPVILSETAIARNLPQGRMLAILAGGIRRNHLLGFVWFDAVSHRVNTIDWRLNRTAPTVAAFHKEVTEILHP